MITMNNNILNHINNLIYENSSSKIPTLKFLKYDSKQDLNKVKFIHDIYRKRGNYKKILQKAYPDYEGTTDKDFTEYYETNKKEIVSRVEDSSKKAKQHWKKVSNKYFSKIRDITEFDWEHNQYNCVFSAVWASGGGYNEEHKLAMVSPFGTPERIAYLISHELFHIHFWDTTGKILNTKKKLGQNGDKFWVFSETMINYVLNELNIKGIPVKSEYGHDFKSLHNKIYPLWKNRNSYEEFIREAIKVI